jgi:hypothetical protein
MTKRASKKEQAFSAVEIVDPLIRFIRGQRIILDFDLARIYGVTTKRLNEQVKRNRQRFPSDFMFQLTMKESNSMFSYPRSQFATLNRSQIATGSQKHRDPRFLPYAFTEHGVVMAANVLNSERAVVMSVYVVRAFVKLRELLGSSVELAKKLDELERKLTTRQDVHEKAIVQLFSQIRELLRPPPPQQQPKRRRIGF